MTWKFKIVRIVIRKPKNSCNMRHYKHNSRVVQQGCKICLLQFNNGSRRKTGRNDNRGSPKPEVHCIKISLRDNEIWACDLCHSGAGHLATIVVNARHMPTTSRPLGGGAGGGVRGFSLTAISVKKKNPIKMCGIEIVIT